MKEMRYQRFAGEDFLNKNHMGKLRTLIIILILSSGLTTTVSAQASRLQQGKDQFLDGSYYKALEYLTQAITLDRGMTGEMYTEAYYYRGLTYIRIYNEVFSGDDEKAKKTYQDALLSAYRDFKSSLGYDDGLAWKQIDLEIKNLHHPLLQEGLSSLNTYNDQVYSGKADPKMLAHAEEYLVAAHEIRETYLVCDLLGQVYLDKGDKEQAADYFEKSEKLYTEKLPAEPDFLMAYVFYRLAAIHKSTDIRLAMQDNQRGLNFLDSEYTRFRQMKEKLDPKRVAEMEAQYNLARQDLTNLKLDLYLSSPDQYVEALHVFEQQIASDPSNTGLLIGYASLLEQSDKERAIMTYKKVIQLDPVNEIALYNIGALYYSKGKDLLDAAKKAPGDDQYALLTSEADANFKTAGGYFEQALKQNANSIETVQALKTIAFILDDKISYDKYKKMEEGLTK